MIRQAFVLGAGLGLRLRPMTEHMPKPLVPIFNKRLITFSLDHLRSIGVESFVINTNRLPEQFEIAFGSGEYEGAPVKLAHEPDLLETGGGIKNAEPLLRRDEPFITYSGDILTDVDLQPLVDEHFAKGNDVTLGLREDGLSTDIALRDGRVTDIAGKFGTQGTCDFAGVAVWNASIFERIPPKKKTSFIPIVVNWIAEGGKIGGVALNHGKWFNIGSRDGYLEAHRTIAEEPWKPAYVADQSWPLPVAPDAEVDPTAKLSGVCSVGAGSRIGAGAILENTIVWPGAQIASRSELRNCIVRSHQTAEGILRDVDI